MKQTKKLKSENAELSQKVTDLEVQVKFLTVELDKYRQPVTFSREQLKKSAERVSELEQLKSRYRKTIEFINSHALATEFEVFQHIRQEVSSWNDCYISFSVRLYYNMYCISAHIYFLYNIFKFFNYLKIKNSYH